MTRLNLMPEVEHVDTIDCRDLFNGKNDRERIEVFRLMNVDWDTGDRHSRTPMPTMTQTGNGKGYTRAEPSGITKKTGSARDGLTRRSSPIEHALRMPWSTDRCTKSANAKLPYIRHPTLSQILYQRRQKNGSYFGMLLWVGCT